MNILSLFVQWYVLMGLYHEHNTNPWKHSYMKYRTDLEYFYHIYTKQLAMVIRQKVLQHALWEANYSCTECDHTFIKRMKNEPRNYSPQGLIPAFLKIFSYNWEESMGGKPWLKIARALTIKDDAMFLDTIIDLEHNGGNILKDFCSDGFYTPSLNGLNVFNLFLEIKAHESVDTIMKYYGVYVSWWVKNLYTRRCNLIGVSNDIRMDSDPISSVDYGYIDDLVQSDNDVLAYQNFKDNIGDYSVIKLFKQKPWKFKEEPIPQIIKNLNYHPYDEF